MGSAIGGIGGGMQPPQSGLQVVGSAVGEVVGTIGKQHGTVNEVHGRCQNYVSQVSDAWLGGDAEAFAQDVVTKLLPAIARLAAAIAGMNTNIGQANDIVSQANQKSTGLANGLGDTFGQIMGGG